MIFQPLLNEWLFGRKAITDCKYADSIKALFDIE